MRRVIRPLWLALLLLPAIGAGVALLGRSSGSGGTEGREPSPDAASIDLGEGSLRGAGPLPERARTPTSERTRDVVTPAPTVSQDPPGPGEVVGQVVDPEGHPVAAELWLYVDGAWHWFRHTTTTDAQGRFRVRPHPQVGTSWSGVLALARPVGRTAPLTPAQAGAAPLRIVAFPVREARISVVDEAGQGVAIAKVRVGHPRGPTSFEAPPPWIERGEELAAWTSKDAYTDRNGVAAVLQTPTTATGLTITGPLDRDLQPGSLLGWDGGDAIVRLSAKPRVEGTVREVDGGLLTDGKVSWRRSGADEWKEVRVEYDGTYSIDCGEPGAIELCARMHNAFPRTPVASRVVPSGALNVALLAEAGPTLDVRLGGWIEEAQGAAVLLLEPADAPEAPRLVVKIDDGRILVRGLDAGAKYTLWVPPLARVSGAPMEVEPPSLCVLRTGLHASDAPVTVALARSHRVMVRLGKEWQRQGWHLRRITARGHGVVLDLPITQMWRAEGPDAEASVTLPPGSFRLRVEAERFVSTQADVEAGRILTQAYAGEADWTTGAERVDVDLEPVTDAPVERPGG